MTLISNVPGAALPNLADPMTFVPGVPHEAFAVMRATPGLYWQPTSVGTVNGGFWAVTRFADILEIEKDPATFTSTRGPAYPSMNQPQENNPSLDMLMLTDPPRHSYLRRAAAKGFGPRIVANFEPWVREIVADTLDGLDGKDEFDWVEEVAKVVPALVLARVLGVSDEDSDQFVGWALGIFSALSDLKEGDDIVAVLGPIFMSIAEYAERIQAEKKANPADDMFTELTMCVERGEISQNEFVQWMQVMMTAGFETTHTAIGQSMRMYLEDPQVAERTDRAVDEGLSDRVADEYIRLISPPMEMARTATRDVEVSGTAIRTDDVVVLYFVSANRDSAIFSRPDEFDPWRSEKETLAFGSGVHRCIGAYLAKLEVRVVWEEICRRRLDLRLNGEPQRGWSVFINQLSTLPVART